MNIHQDCKPQKPYNLKPGVITLPQIEKARRITELSRQVNQALYCTCRTEQGGEADEVSFVQCDFCANFESLCMTEPEGLN